MNHIYYFPHFVFSLMCVVAIVTVSVLFLLDLKFMNISIIIVFDSCYW